MKALLTLAAQSAWNRRGTLALVMLSIALATGLLLTLERLRTDIRASFLQAVSGTDLVVGAEIESCRSRRETNGRRPLVGGSWRWRSASRMTQSSRR